MLVPVVAGARPKMSYCRREGKDTIIFATKEDHAVPSTVTLPEVESGPGLILPNGDINWNCPCLGGMASGPCGVQFREAFSCFHHSTADPKGSDCYESFATMQNCMQNYPTVYEKNKGADDDDDDLDLGAALEESVERNEAQTNTLAAEQSEKADTTLQKGEKAKA